MMVRSYWIAHATAQKITETAKLLDICNSFSTYRIVFNIVRRRSEMTHQQRVSRSGPAVTERAVGEWHHRPPIAFVLERTF